MGFAHSLTHSLSLTHSAPQEPNVITIANRHHLFSTQMSTSNYLAVYLFQAFRPVISLDPFLLHHGVNPRGCFYVSAPLVRTGLANGTVKLRKTTVPWNSILLEILVGCSTHSLTHLLTYSHTHSHYSTLPSLLSHLHLKTGLVRDGALLHSTDIQRPEHQGGGGQCHFFQK
jgi:hypothetical protein